VKSSLHAMMNAATKAECERLIATFAADHEARYPKAVKSLQTEADKLTTYLIAPAEHWKAPAYDEPDRVDVRDREAASTRDEGRGLARGGTRQWPTAYCSSAEASRRRLNGHQLLPLVRAGVELVDDSRAERDDVASNAAEEDRDSTQQGRRLIRHPQLLTISLAQVPMAYPGVDQSGEPSPGRPDPQRGEELLAGEERQDAFT